MNQLLEWSPLVIFFAVFKLYGIYWATAAVAFLGSTFMGNRPLARRVLENVFSEPLELSRRSWVLINLGWALWFAGLAAANLYIAWNFSESVWVNFKFFSITVALMIFMIPQVIWLHGKTAAAPAEGGT